jgi:hypothetical protein
MYANGVHGTALVQLSFSETVPPRVAAHLGSPLLNRVRSMLLRPDVACNNVGHAPCPIRPDPHEIPILALYARVGRHRDAMLVDARHPGHARAARSRASVAAVALTEAAHAAAIISSSRGRMVALGRAETARAPASVPFQTKEIAP